MGNKGELQRMMEEAVQVSQTSREQVLEDSLRLFLGNYGQYKGVTLGPSSKFDTLDAAKLLVAAHDMASPDDGMRVSSFTMDELLDLAFPGQTLLAEHDVKVWAGRLLAAAGYERRQVRRSGGLRPLVWERSLPFGKDSINP